MRGARFDYGHEVAKACSPGRKPHLARLLLTSNFSINVRLAGSSAVFVADVPEGSKMPGKVPGLPAALGNDAPYGVKTFFVSFTQGALRDPGLWDRTPLG